MSGDSKSISSMRQLDRKVKTLRWLIVKQSKSMDEESIVTPPAEEIATQDGSVGSISTEIETTPTENETVPLNVYLTAKADKKQLKTEVAELRAELQSFKSAQKPSELKAKYQDSTTTEFLDDVEALIDKKAEEKVAPLRFQAQKEKEDRALNALINEQLAKAE